MNRPTLLHTMWRSIVLWCLILTVNQAFAQVNVAIECKVDSSVLLQSGHSLRHGDIVRIEVPIYSVEESDTFAVYPQCKAEGDAMAKWEYVQVAQRFKGSSLASQKGLLCFWVEIASKDNLDNGMLMSVPFDAFGGQAGMYDVRYVVVHTRKGKATNTTTVESSSKIQIKPGTPPVPKNNPFIHVEPPAA